MNCPQCRREVLESSIFCSFGGARVQRINRFPKRLTLSATNSKLTGVCGGLGEYFDVDPTLVRLVWVALSVFPGGIVGGILAYVLAWIIIPKASTLVSKATEAPLEHAMKEHY